MTRGREIDAPTMAATAHARTDTTAAESRSASTAPLLLDAGEAARLLGIGRSTFYRLDETGGVPRGVHIGRMRRWRSDELRAWIAAGCPARVRWEERCR